MRSCCPHPPLCDQCVRDELAHFYGVAACRGETWARKVAAQVRTRQPWPEYEGKVIAMARGKVADIATDDRLLDTLARIVNEWAAKRWGTV